MIPTVSVPPNGNGQFNCSMWVGQVGGDPVSLLQAGVEHEVSSGWFGGPSYYPWLEWFPAESVKINNFPVAPGQTIIVMVGVVDGANQDALSGPGQVSMVNLSTGTGITPIVVPIPTVDFNGNAIDPPITKVPSEQANWILERPSEVVNGVPTPNKLADYGAAVMNGGTFFKDAEAIFVGEEDHGRILNMLGNDGVTTLSSAGEAPELMLQFTGGSSQ
jgi:hypothetical protein